MSKILFLDFDGVLNGLHWLTNPELQAKLRSATSMFERFAQELDPVLVNRVDQFVIDNDLKVVICSSWRILNTLDELKQYLTLSGWTSDTVIDITPKSPKGFRGDDINLWLDAHPEVTEYVIFDDGSDFYDYQKLIQTNIEIGVTSDDIKRAQEVFKK